MTARTRSTTRSPAERLALAGRSCSRASPTVPKGWCSPISRASIAAGRAAPPASLAVVCRDGQRMAALARALAFFAPDLEVLEFPAWDCLPYDRVSPHAGVVAQRMTALSRLARLKGRERPAVC